MSRKTRMHRQERQNQEIPDDDDEFSVVDAPDITEVVDDEPIEVLRKSLEEAKAEKKAAEERFEAAERDKAAQAAQHTVSELGQQKMALEHAFEAADLKAQQAVKNYAAAMSEQRFEEAAAVQREMARLESEMGRYRDAYQMIEQREKAPRPQADDFDSRVSQIPDANTQRWAMDHKDDLKNPQRLQLAYAADNLALARGLKLGSDEYLDFMDAQMGYEYEEEPEPKPVRTVPSVRRAPPVAAPASRASGGGSSRSVHLTADDKRIAHQLGYSDKDYAAFKLASEKDPRHNRYNGRAR